MKKIQSCLLGALLVSSLFITTQNAVGQVIVNVASAGAIRDGVFDGEPGDPNPGDGQDWQPTTVFQFVVSGQPTITKVALRFSAEHDSPVDLTAALVSPQGTRVFLFDGIGDPNALSQFYFQDTLFDDSAPVSIISDFEAQPWPGPEHPGGSRYRPQFYNASNPSLSLSAFIGQNPNGTWQLEVTDNLPGESGFLYESGDGTQWGNPAIGTQLILNNAVVPEPQHVAVMAGVGLLVFAGWRRKCRLSNPSAA
jgi:subtilisin-like proprotein convertase family protein